jgi:site-specific DNA-methyltransferase (adenine-specific)
MVLTSPPYDNLRNYKGYKFDFEGIAKQLFRIVKVGGVVVWVVGDATINGSETGTSFKQALYFKKIGFNLHDTMIYQKSGMSMPDINRYYQNFEYMFVISKGKPLKVNLLKDKINKWGGKSSFGNVSSRGKDGKLKKKDKIITNEYGVRFNIWKYNTGYGYSAEEEISYQHPAIFPEKLAEDHILSWSNKGDLILDPMNGSGTTTKMAQKLGRNFIGIEISKEYCEIARQRLRQKPLI